MAIKESVRRWDDIDECDDSLYDSSPGIGDPLQIEINGGLFKHELEDALWWAKTLKQLWGLMVITGPKGSGKGVFMYSLLWKFKRYFDKRVMLDQKPRRPFGKYLFFNDENIAEQVDRMKEIAEGETTCGWETVEGDEVIIKDSAWGMDEFRRRHFYRNPNAPINNLMNAFYNIIRHPKIFVIGATVEIGELDKKACLKHTDYWVKMSRVGDDGKVFKAAIHRVKWIEDEERFYTIWKKTYRIDGAKPRIELGIKPYDQRIGDIHGYETKFGKYELTERMEEKYFIDYDEDGNIIFEYHYEDFNEEKGIWTWHEDIYYRYFDLLNSENAIGLDVPKSMRPKEKG